MAVEIHEDQPLPSPAGMNTALVEAVATTGNQLAAAAWALLPEMTLTIACNAGDLLLLMFTGNLYINNQGLGEIRFEVNGVQQGFDYRIAQGDNPSVTAQRSVWSAMQMYTVPAAGNYIVEVWWHENAGDDLRRIGNETTLTVARYY